MYYNLLSSGGDDVSRDFFEEMHDLHEASLKNGFKVDGVVPRADLTGDSGEFHLNHYLTNWCVIHIFIGLLDITLDESSPRATSKASVDFKEVNIKAVTIPVKAIKPKSVNIAEKVVSDHKRVVNKSKGTLIIFLFMI